MNKFSRPLGKFTLHPRNKSSNKTDFGHTLVIAGSQGLCGAAVLTCRGALRAGAGLVTLGISESLVSVAAKHLVEAMQFGLPENKDKSLSLVACKNILALIRRRRVNVLAVGPGLGRNVKTAALVRKLIMKSSLPVVLDADGIRSFCGYQSLLKKHRQPLILTPHAGEFEALFGIRFPENKADRIKLAGLISAHYGIVLVLKSHRTVVAESGRTYEIKGDNPALATGGSGDVLTGVIAGFLAQGLKAYEAACWGVYMHSLAGTLAVKTKGPIGVVAGDVAESIPLAIKKHIETGQ